MSHHHPLPASLLHTHALPARQALSEGATSRYGDNQPLEVNGACSELTKQCCEKRKQPLCKTLSCNDAPLPSPPTTPVPHTCSDAKVFGAPELVETAHLMTPFSHRGRHQMRGLDGPAEEAGCAPKFRVGDSFQGPGTWMGWSREQKIAFIMLKLTELEQRQKAGDHLAIQGDQPRDVTASGLLKCPSCDYKTKIHETLEYHIRVSHRSQGVHSSGAPSRKIFGFIPHFCKPSKWFSRSKPASQAYDSIYLHAHGHM